MALAQESEGTKRCSQQTGPGVEPAALAASKHQIHVQPLAARNMSRIGPANAKPERLNWEQARAGYK